MAAMHRITLSLKPLSSPLILNNAILCIRPVQKRYKHGRDFPRNIPRPDPPSGEPIFSTPSMTLHHSPAPSAPSYKTPPTSFLPDNHPYTPSSSIHPIGTQLPPPLNKRRPREKKYHLTEEHLNEMRILRNHPDPTQRKSRNELAKMYGCSQFFVGMAAPLTKKEVQEVFRKREEQRQSWGEKKRFFRDTRAKRRAEWTQSEE